MAANEVLHGERLLTAVTEAMIAMHERYHGSAPAAAKSLMMGDDLLACVLGGVYTEVEKTMIELQRSTIVQQTRSAFQQAMQQKFIEAVEALSGRRVRAFISNHHVSPDLEIELFVLGPLETKESVMSYQQAIYQPWSDDSAPFSCVSAPDGPGVTRLTLTGELDLATAPELRAALYDAAEDAELVIVDLTALAFMDSAGLFTIVTAHRQFRDAGRRLALTPGQRQVQRIFELAGLADKLPFKHDNPLSRSGNTRLPHSNPPARATIGP